VLSEAAVPDFSVFGLVFSFLCCIYVAVFVSISKIKT